MRAALAVILLASACGAPGGASASKAPTQSALAGTACQPTTSRDAAGVVTANGLFGVIGETSTVSVVALYEPLVIVRKGATAQASLALLFNDIGNTSPGRSVSYGVAATARANPWGAFVFDAGWKPIGFAGSCWQVMADGTDTGIVLFVRP